VLDTLAGRVCDGEVDVELSPDQELLKETTRRFIADSWPLERVREAADSGEPTGPGYGRQAAELGWFGLVVPESMGGGSVSGNGVFDAAIVGVERGRALQPGPFVAANVVAHALATAGADEQQRRSLRAIVSGDATATWAVADEIGAFDGPGGVTVSGDGDHIVLHGAKSLTIDADLADWIFVTGADEAGGVTQVLVPSSARGLTARPLAGLDISRRFGEVRFDGVELSSSAVVGERGRAIALVDDQLRLAAVLTMAESVGAMDALFTLALDYAKDRIAFGRPIGSFQAVKHLLVDTSVLLETSKAVATAAAQSVGSGKAEAPEVVAMAKSTVADAGVQLAQSCFQIFGGIGFTWAHDNHLFLRRLTADAALYGDAAWHRERIWVHHGM
jgi:alkylation response protein AidB-like acyl-CoA dehydrogenase